MSVEAFKDELEELRETRDELQSDIESIEERLDEIPDMSEFEDDLSDLEETLNMEELPEDWNESSVEGIERVQVNPETGKPPRGARSRQINQAIEVLTEKRGQNTFKAGDVFDLMKEADPSIDEGRRNYVYNRLRTLREEGDLVKIERGVWARPEDVDGEPTFEDEGEEQKDEEETEED